MGVMRSGAHNEIGSKAWHYGVPFCSLSGNDLGAEGGKAIAEALKVNTSIAIINLYRSDLGAEGGKAIAAALKVNTSITNIK